MFTLNGIAIKNPQKFSIERYTLTKSTRVACGDMVMEFVANKRKFTFGYDSISGKELDGIIDILWEQLVTTKNCFATLAYPYNGSIKTCIVYAGSIPASLHRGDGMGDWVWKDVQFSLIEK